MVIQYCVEDWGWDGGDRDLCVIFFSYIYIHVHLLTINVHLLTSFLEALPCLDKVSVLYYRVVGARVEVFLPCNFT